jgi:nuclear transport factor 2 (NTF2) superfamily protein
LKNRADFIFMKVEAQNRVARREDSKRHAKAVKEITASKENALAFLAKTGVYDKDGNLKPAFR